MKKSKDSLIRLAKNPRVRKHLIKLFRSFLLGTQKYKFAALPFRKQRWYWIMLSQALRQLGDSRGALENLLKGLEHHKDYHLFHFRISQIFRENYQIPESHGYLKAADELKPGANTILRLLFESEFRMFEEGSKTMVRVMDLPLPIFRSKANLIDRISIHYPEHNSRLTELRNEIKETMRKDSYETEKKLSKAVAEAIGHRQIALACELGAGQILSTTIQERLDRITKSFGENLGMLETAWKNESSPETYFFIDGKQVSAEDPATGSRKIVELFIPPAIFDYPPREKRTHETIREMFLNIIPILCSRNDIAIVPRMQLNWRECFPKTRGSHVISYHTSGPFNPLHLHVQEAPFSGYCSFDHAGFAGFSHTASNHEDIVEFTASVTDEALDANQAEMHEKYVTGNISKYDQSADSKPINGPYVFVALQVVTDVVAKLAWMPGIELLENVAAHYRGTGTQVVVKRHPFCRSMDVQKCIERLEAAGDIVSTSNSIHDVLKDAKLVFTVNSGVGLEALMHGKAVIVSGACDYSYAARQARTPEELQRILTSSPVPDQRRIKEMLYFYMNSFAIFSTDKERLEVRLSSWLEN